MNPQTDDPNLTVSSPFCSSHNVHISIAGGKIEGIPEVVREAINKTGYTDEQILKDPLLIKDLLYSFQMDDVLKSLQEEISRPTSVSHDFSIRIDPSTGKVTGVPDEIIEAIQKAGYTLEQVTKDPTLVKDLLYNFDYNKVKLESIKVSPPVQIQHDFSIQIDPATGQLQGVPGEIIDAIKTAGYSLEEVMKNPMLVKDLLYNFDYNSLKPDAPKISLPVKTSHDFSIHVDPATGEIKGVPAEILEAIKNAGYTLDQVMKDPMLVKNLLYNFDYDSLKPDAPKISPPEKTTHDFSIQFDPETGDVKGVPQEILDAIKNAGYTIQQVVENPLIVKNILYNFDYDTLKPDAPKISSPIQVSHDFHIEFDPDTGEIKGVPPAIMEAISAAGYTIEQIKENPLLVQDILYKLDYSEVKESAQPQVSKPTNVQHDFSIKYDPVTGQVSGVPEVIRQACIAKGYTEEQVLNNPNLINDLLYSLDYESVKKNTEKKQ